MSPLTILRIEKLKTFGNVAGSDDHVTRNRETPNADPTLIECPVDWGRRLTRLGGDS
ncbi:hypothetical protein [Nostoc sp. KVJ3]|uniref:hypothetical protein n=1 Tax=Nostoc sp. KVJ3 TaxID=457945 RepID=UPI002AA2ADAD|nr:hypothetical protein [Nostoc sp. KVJ3]